MTRPEVYEPYRIDEELNRDIIPKPVFEKEPKFVDLYWKAWELAWEHVLKRDDMPQKLYLDEAMTPDQIWIWDTCFMSLFCRYASQQFPGIESLNNFYRIIHDKYPSAAKIHFSDNPPLFAWVEWNHYQITGDKKRLEWLVKENKYLQKHFDYIENCNPKVFSKKWWKSRKIYVNAKVLCGQVVKKYELGYKWRGNTSGMDNTPRGRNGFNDKFLNPRGQISRNKILWIDLISQQALSALYIKKIADELELPDLSNDYIKKYEKLKSIVNEYYWDEEDGIYYDLRRVSSEEIRKSKSNEDNNRFHKVQSIASFWPLLAEISDPMKADQLTELLLDPNKFGGSNPFPSISRDDEDYDVQGRYWRGAIWLPTSYMTIKGLEKYNKIELADKLADDLLALMLKTYEEFEPNSIWECYSPSEAKPGSQKKNERYSEPDFCGWSALGPISIFIENILGFHDLNAAKQEICWRIHQDCVHGIEKLRLGENVITLVYHPTSDDRSKKVLIEAELPFILNFTDGEGKVVKKIDISAGKNEILI